MSNPPDTGLSFRTKEWVSIAGGATNEDGGGSGAHVAWLLDGATGLPQERLLPGDSDAQWLVAEACAFLERRTDLERPADVERLDHTPAAQHLSALSAFLSRRFHAARVRAASPDRPEELPSASLAFAVIEGQSLTIANIGDCRTLVRFPDGASRQFGDSPVSALDAQVLRRLVELQRSDPKLSFPALKAEVAPLIRRNRLLKNQPNGYWVVEPGESWLQHVQYFSVGVAPGTAALMLSDGFYRLVDHYHLYNDESLIAAAVNDGLNVLAQRLRQVEAEDPECRTHPRLKPRDDASALLLMLDHFDSGRRGMPKCPSSR
jgi:serine/threonine protein phosphatase PrpC